MANTNEVTGGGEQTRTAQRTRSRSRSRSASRSRTAAANRSRTATAQGQQGGANAGRELFQQCLKAPIGQDNPIALIMNHVYGRYCAAHASNTGPIDFLDAVAWARVKFGGVKTMTAGGAGV